MATEVFLPKVDMVMEEATLVEWLIAEGDPVKKGQPLFVILTDKASIEIESPADGILAGVSAKPDDVVPVAATIAYILEPGESLPDGPTAGAVAPEPGAAAGADMNHEAAEPPTPGSGGPVTDRARATPVARRLAAELGLDLAALVGRGPRGRIHKADVLAAAERVSKTGRPTVPAQPATPLPASIPLPDAEQSAVVPLAGPRRIIAQRMAYSATTVPHISLSLTVNMTEAARIRSRLGSLLEDKTGYRLSYTAILARAVAAVLRRHPYLNSSLAGDEIILWKDIHLGVATSVEDYLIVPVIRQAQSKNLEQITGELGDLLTRARSRQLAPSQMSGSTFTISNMGMFDIESFTAIINPPEAAILAAGAILERPVRGEAGIELQPAMTLTICADHRVVDGVAAAHFLADLKATLENPYVLI